MIFHNFKVISWNVRGAANLRGQRFAKELVRQNQPHIFVLLETHCTFQSVAHFWRKMGYTGCFIQEAQGFSGGIWVLCPLHRDFTVISLDSFHQAITFSVTRMDSTWCYSAIYASLNPSVREGLWSHLVHLKSTITALWLLIGDFNEILSPAETRGGSFSMSKASRFSRALDDCDLMNMEAIGNGFTWFHS